MERLVTECQENGFRCMMYLIWVNNTPIICSESLPIKIRGTPVNFLRSCSLSNVLRTTLFVLLTYYIYHCPLASYFMYGFWLCWPLRNGQVLRRIALRISTSRDIYRRHVSLYASRNVLGGGLLMIDCWRWLIAHVSGSLSGASQGNMTCALLGNYIWKLYIWEAQVVGSLAALGHLLMFRSSASRFTWYS